MIDINNYLKEIGLSDVESKIYEALIHLGPSTIKEISDYTQINRITVHFNTEKLIEKGLVNQTKKGSKRLLYIDSPKRIRDLIDNKIIVLKQHQQNFYQVENFIKNNLKFKAQNSKKLEIKYFLGKKEISWIYEDVLSGREMRSYVNLEIVSKVFPKNVDLFVQKMNNNPQLRVWEIVEDSITAQRETKIFSQNKRYHYKITSRIHLSAADVMIYDGKVAVVNLGKNISGTIFYNNEFYQISKEIFDFVWQTIP